MTTIVRHEPMPHVQVLAVIEDPARGVVSLVGDRGGLSRITGDVQISHVIPGMVRVETEHGTVYLDDDQDMFISEETGTEDPRSASSPASTAPC